MPELSPGDKYLYIELVGHKELRAFPNRKKKSPKEPDFKADGKGYVKGFHNISLL